MRNWIARASPLGIVAKLAIGSIGLVWITVILFGISYLGYRLGSLVLIGEWHQFFQLVREIIRAGGCYATFFLISHTTACEIIGWILAVIPVIGCPSVGIAMLIKHLRTKPLDNYQTEE